MYICALIVILDSSYHVIKTATTAASLDLKLVNVHSFLKIFKSFVSWKFEILEIAK